MIDYKKALELKQGGKPLKEIMEELNIDVKYKTFQRALYEYEKTGHEREFRKIESLDADLREVVLEAIRKGTTLEELEYQGVSKRVSKALIEDLKEEGYEIGEVNGIISILKTVIGPVEEHKEEWNGEEEIIFGVVSDTHLCSKYQQITFLNEAYDKFKELGIKKVYHCGDISDGFYKNRDQQIYEIFKFGVDEQAEYIIENYPKREGITTDFIIGNHDNTAIINGGANIGKMIAREREDMNYLGHSFAKVWLTPKCDMDLVHPIDGSAYALSYSGQKYCDSLSGGEKPKIIAMGHHHKFFYMFYRNIHFIEVPTTQAQTPFMKGKKLPAYTGALICRLKVDKEGTIKNFNVELLPLYKALENDF